MKSVLVGNGINIQFGGKAYSNEFIMNRIIFNALANRYDSLFEGMISGERIEEIYRAFIDIANKAINGDYDAIGDSDDWKAIKDFKNRYVVPIKQYYNIMLEDWFLLIRLFFITNADLKDQWQPAKQGFERMILDGIYNEGMLNKVYLKMNKKVKRYFTKFDYIFSLNYDCNLESLTGRNVLHLHGNYSILADSENPDTVEGYIRQQAGQLVVIDEFRHCFCNALLNYSGDLKLKRASHIKKVIKVMEHWLELSKYDEANYKKKIAHLKEKSEDTYQFIRTYVQNPNLKVGTDYHFETLSNLEGELYIIGLSPNNDSHIFRCINESKLDEIKFYYFSDIDKDIPITKPYKSLYVGDLWKSLDVENEKYNCSYPLPNDIELDKFIKVFNEASFYPISKKRILDEVNSIPLFEAHRLCTMVRKELEDQKSRRNPKSENELFGDFREVSRIALREGILPPALFMLYAMNHKV